MKYLQLESLEIDSGGIPKVGHISLPNTGNVGSVPVCFNSPLNFGNIGSVPEHFTSNIFRFTNPGLNSVSFWSTTFLNACADLVHISFRSCSDRSKDLPTSLDCLDFTEIGVLPV